jgi:phosphate-selective porin OprO/OprP
MMRIMQAGGLRRLRVALLASMLASSSVGARAQDGTPSIAPLPDASRVAAPVAGATNQELLERLLKMEDRLDQVTKQNEQLSREIQELRRVNRDRRVEVDALGDAARPNAGQGGASTRRGGPSPMPPATSGGGSASGGGDPTKAGSAQLVGNRHRGRSSLLGGTYDFENDGFRWSTEDDEVTIGVRVLQQIDARIYANSSQEFANSGIFNPRTRLYFEGNLSRPVSYEFSLQHFYSTTNLLDSYVNYRFSDGFQLRFGRYKTPFDYEWYRIHIWHTLAPERSPFAQNFGGNRRLGFMGWGSLFDNRLEYAVGSFNGQRNGYTAFNSHQDIMAFLNFKPFEQKSDFILQNLQVGGSLDAGIENNPLSPAVLMTSSPATPFPLTPGSASVPFLAFNDGVRERGGRALWELHVAYHYRGLSFLGTWDSGFQDYAHGSSGPPPVRIPTGGYFAQVGYVLTGETVRDRMLIEPLRPFDLRPGRFALGALELTARFSDLTLGRQVFTGGLADPNLWTNQVQMVDVGLNWYLNRFLKIYFDWEHAMFATPVFYNTGRFQKSNDLFWIRCQVFF